MRRRTVLLAAALSAFALAGCGLTRPAVEIHTYLVVAGAPQGNKAASPLRIRVTPFDIAPQYEGKPLIYRFSDARFEADFYNEFLVSPRLMLQQQTAEWLRAAGHDASTAARGNAYRLRAKVIRMYGDFRQPQQPRAVLDVVFVLDAPDGGSTVLEREYAVSTPIADRSADSVARGLGEALGQVLTQLHTDLQAVGQPDAH